MPTPPKGRRFQPGVSGNPSGRPKIIKTIQEIARQEGPASISTLVEIRDNKKSPAPARVAAANAILDRGYGRPPQFNTNDATAFRKATEMSDDELAAIAAGEPQGSGAHLTAQANGSGKPH